MTRHDQPDWRYQAVGAAYGDVLVTFSAEHDGEAHLQGAGTHIGNGWVVTAAHVAAALQPGGTARIGEVIASIGLIVWHPWWEADGLDHDIGLVRLVDLPGDTPAACLYDAEDEAGRTAILVGRGDTGDGVTGVSSSDGLLRGARNIVNEATPLWLVFGFETGRNGLPLEGISGPGDSGGPALFEDDDTLCVAGISSWQRTPPPAHVEGTYGAREHYTRVNRYREWIDAQLELTRPSIEAPALRLPTPPTPQRQPD